MTPSEAKKQTAATAMANGLRYVKLTAKSVSFQDLARGSCIFVTVHGPTISPAWENVRAAARAAGFLVDFH